MSKKQPSKKNKKEQDQLPEQIEKLPKEVQDKLKGIKVKLDKFQKQILDKFGNYIVGISLLPPKAAMPEPGMPPPNPGQPPQIPEEEKDKINVLVLIDDTDSQKMSKMELKDKLTKIIAETAKDIDKNLTPETVILSELWQSCYDSKHEMLSMIAMGAPVYDKGMLQAIKITEIHKSMVLKKFEKYIVSYVLAGSLVQGRATPESDIDVCIIIDDTDVKKMTRAELKDKLRAIIIGMGLEAGEMTGIKNKLNIQPWILTEFWDGIREANPVFFTFLRDGIPFHDRGTFMPMKQLLKLGKIKPSAEAIDMFLGSGEQMIRRVKGKLSEIGMEDIYYALLTPSQAALMMYGIPPPTPRETPEVMLDIFVKKEKLLEEKYVKMLDHQVKLRKAIEHGEKKELTGKEIDETLNNSEKYLSRIKRLFSQIEKMREEKDMVHAYDTVITVMRDVLRAEEIEKVQDAELVSKFEDEMISSGKIPAKFLRTINEIMKAKDDHDSKKLSKVDVENVRKESGALIRFLVEYIQRKRGRELEKAKIRVKYGKKFGEVLLLGGEAFIIHDIDVEQKEISKAKINEDGGLATIQKGSFEDLEKALAEFKSKERVFIKGKIFEDLKRVFGKDVEILVNY